MIGFLKKHFKKDQLILLAAGMSATILICYLFQVQPRFLEHLSLKIYDQYLKEYHTAPATDVPVIIDLDERSINALGQWPWPRYRVALLLKYLQIYGAASVATDIIFVEPDRTSLGVIQKSVKDDLNYEMDFSKVPSQLMDNDKTLASILKQGPFVLGMDFVPFDHHNPPKPLVTQPHVTPAKVSIISAAGAPSPHEIMNRAGGVISPIPVLATAAPREGFITTSPDLDSVYRKVPLLYSWNNKFYPSLAMAALIQATGKENITLKVSSEGVESIRFNGVQIPTNRNGQLLVNYRGKAHSFEYISALDVLQKKLKPGALQGRIAFIGTSASGLKDIRPTPLDPSCPGVEVHASVVDNILSQQFLITPDWAIGMEFLGIVLSGLITTFLLMWARSNWLIVPLLVMGTAMWYGSVNMYKGQGYFISPMYSYITLAFNFTLLTMIKFWREENAKRFIHGAFAHYLAPSVISQIMENPDALSLEGQEKDITIQFSDVRSFTTLSEKLSPTQVTDLLHDYLTPMTAIITEYDGTLDKFIGDAVMAFWNAPLDVENHPKRSLEAALAQQVKLEELNDMFMEKYGFTIAVGIGIHSGPVRVGNMGSADLFDYTLIGDNVNLASRLEGLTKYYGQKLVVSQTIKDACGEEYYFRFLDSVRVKGKEEPITIYTAYTLEDATKRSEELALYDEALEAYRSRDFAKAKSTFEHLLQTDVEPVLMEMYIDRCSHLMEYPPEPDWDMVFTHETK